MTSHVTYTTDWESHSPVMGGLRYCRLGKSQPSHMGGLRYHVTYTTDWGKSQPSHGRFEVSRDIYYRLGEVTAQSWEV